MNAYGQNYPGDAPTHRLAALFEDNQDVPISRTQITETAPQLDSMKRLRRNGGARDVLDSKGIALLWGGRDRHLIAQLGLGPVTKDQFISHTPKSQAELDLIRANGHGDLQEPDTF